MQVCLQVTTECNIEQTQCRKQEYLIETFDIKHRICEFWSSPANLHCSRTLADMGQGTPGMMKSWIWRISFQVSETRSLQPGLGKPSKEKNLKYIGHLPILGGGTLGS